MIQALQAVGYYALGNKTLCIIIVITKGQRTGTHTQYSEELSV